MRAPVLLATLILVAFLTPAAVANEAPRVLAGTPTGRVSEAMPLVRAVFSDDGGVVADRTVLRVDGVDANVSYRSATEVRGTPAAPLAPGVHEAAVLVRDAEGRTAQYTWNFEVVLAGDVARIVSFGAPSGLVRAVPPIVIVFEGTTLEVTLDGDPVEVSASDGRAVVDLGRIPDGEHRVEATVQGANATRATREAVFTLDATPPTVAFVDTSEIPKAVTVSWTDTQGIRPRSPRVLMDDVVLDASLGADGGRVLLPEAERGPHTLRVEATDLAGNVGNATHAFLVEAPELHPEDTPGRGSTPEGEERPAPIPALGTALVVALAAAGARARGRPR